MPYTQLFATLLVYFCQKPEVTDIGPKDSNFPQNAWGLLDSTVWKSHFRCYTWELWSHHIPGNSDAITTQNVCTAEKKRRSKLNSWSCRCYSTVLLAQISDSASHLSWVTCSAAQLIGSAGISCLYNQWNETGILGPKVMRMLLLNHWVLYKGQVFSLVWNQDTRLT